MSYRSGMTRNIRTWVAMAILCFFATEAAAQPLPRYNLIDLGDLGGTESRAYRINRAGQVVGQSRVSRLQLRAYLWTDGVMHNLGVLNDFDAGNSTANGINNLGQVVGSASTDFDGPFSGVQHAFVWRRGVMTDLGAFPGISESASVANDINSFGEVVGSAEDADGASRPVIWRRGVITDLGTLPGGKFGSAVRMNDRGQIVGQSQGADGLMHAVLWDHGDIINLFPLDATSSAATSINDRGEIVGFTLSPGSGSRPYLWENLEPLNLRILPGDAFGAAQGINRIGLIVGRSEGLTGGGRAVLFDQSGGFPTVLSTLVRGGLGGFQELATANDVNLDGQIVGNGPMGLRGTQRAYLLDPISPNFLP